MNSAFLILYLWHAVGYGNWSIGGPAISITPMPSLAICEQLGSIAKQMVDEIQLPYKKEEIFILPALYRCVEVKK